MAKIEKKIELNLSSYFLPLNCRSPCTSALALDAEDEEDAVEDATATTGVRWCGDEGDAKDKVASDLGSVAIIFIDLGKDAPSALEGGWNSLDDDDELVIAIDVVVAVVFDASIAADLEKKKSGKRREVFFFFFCKRDKWNH